MVGTRSSGTLVPMTDDPGKIGKRPKAQSSASALKSKQAKSSKKKNTQPTSSNASLSANNNTNTPAPTTAASSYKSPFDDATTSNGGAESPSAITTSEQVRQNITASIVPGVTGRPASATTSQPPKSTTGRKILAAKSPANITKRQTRSLAQREGLQVEANFDTPPKISRKRSCPANPTKRTAQRSDRGTTPSGDYVYDVVEQAQRAKRAKIGHPDSGDQSTAQGRREAQEPSQGQLQPQTSAPQNDTNQAPVAAQSFDQPPIIQVDAPAQLPRPGRIPSPERVTSNVGAGGKREVPRNRLNLFGQIDIGTISEEEGEKANPVPRGRSVRDTRPYPVRREPRASSAPPGALNPAIHDASSKAAASDETSDGTEGTGAATPSDLLMRWAGTFFTPIKSVINWTKDTAVMTSNTQTPTTKDASTSVRFSAQVSYKRKRDVKNAKGAAGMLLITEQDKRLATTTVDLGIHVPLDSLSSLTSGPLPEPSIFVSTDRSNSSAYPGARSQRTVAIPCNADTVNLLIEFDNFQKRDPEGNKDITLEQFILMKNKTNGSMNGSMKGSMNGSMREAVREAARMAGQEFNRKKRDRIAKKPATVGTTVTPNQKSGQPLLRAVVGHPSFAGFSPSPAHLAQPSVGRSAGDPPARFGQPSVGRSAGDPPARLGQPDVGRSAGDPPAPRAAVDSPRGLSNTPAEVAQHVADTNDESFENITGTYALNYDAPYYADSSDEDEQPAKRMKMSDMVPKVPDTATKKDDVGIFKKQPAPPTVAEKGGFSSFAAPAKKQSLPPAPQPKFGTAGLPGTPVQRFFTLAAQPDLSTILEVDTPNTTLGAPAPKSPQKPTSLVLGGLLLDISPVGKAVAGISSAEFEDLGPAPVLNDKVRNVLFNARSPLHDADDVFASTPRILAHPPSPPRVGGFEQTPSRKRGSPTSEDLEPVAKKSKR